MYLVLDNVKETTRGTKHKHIFGSKTATDNSVDEEGNTSTRNVGLLVARGTLLVLISPVDGSEEIANPFVQAEDDDE